MEILYDLIKNWKSETCIGTKELKQENPWMRGMCVLFCLLILWESIMQRCNFTESLDILLFNSKINFKIYTSCICRLVAFLNGYSEQFPCIVFRLPISAI